VADARPEHVPVLVEPILRLLDPHPGQTVFDGTVGLGGHAAAILPRVLPGGQYIGVDLDDAMLAIARERLGPQDAGVLRLFKANYADFPVCLQEAGTEAVDLMLLDLGVNSAQLEDPSRGFSFERDGPLDMRFDRDAPETALDLVNRLSERELADLFYQFGQEGASRKIARKICEYRRNARIRSTSLLARAVEAAFTGSRGARRGRLHPATRVFQALRVAINHELDNLETFLAKAPDFLRPGGRLAVISFHSLEDGLVKRFLREMRSAGTFRELTKRPVVAAEEERRRNPRSRSAKLRVAERL